MKNQLSPFLFAVMLACFCSCGNSKPEEKAAPVMESNESTGIKMDLASLASTDDLVCGMSLQDGISDTTTYKQQNYGFCSAGCKEDFLKEPAKYVK